MRTTQIFFWWQKDHTLYWYLWCNWSWCLHSWTASVERLRISLGNNHKISQAKCRAKLSHLGRAVVGILHFLFSCCPWLVDKQSSIVSRSAKWHLSCNKKYIFCEYLKVIFSSSVSLEFSYYSLRNKDFKRSVSLNCRP